MWTLLLSKINEAATLLLAGFMEGTGIPWPGSVIMATIGMQLQGSWELPLLLTLVFSVGYTLGSLAQYAVGYLIGPVALSWLAPRQRRRIERIVERFGVSAMCWTRPIAIGNYVSIPAGMMRMNLWHFSLATFLGAIPWAAGTLWAGRLLRPWLGSLPQYLERWLVPGVVALAVLAILVWGVRVYLSNSTSRPRKSVLKNECPPSSPWK